MKKKGKIKLLITILVVVTIIGFVINEQLNTSSKTIIENVEMENNEIKEKELKENALDHYVDIENGLEAYLIREKRQKIIWITVNSGTVKPPPENISIEKNNNTMIVNVKNSKKESVFTAKTSYHFKVSVDTDIKKIKIFAK